MHGLEEKAADAGVGTEVFTVACSGEEHRIALVGRKLAFLDHPKGELFRGVRADLLDVDVDDERVPGCLRWLKKFQRCEHLREWENHQELVRLGWEDEWELSEEEQRLLDVERGIRLVREIRLRERLDEDDARRQEELRRSQAELRADREAKIESVRNWSLGLLLLAILGLLAKLLIPGV